VRAGETDSALLKPLADGMSDGGGVALVDLPAGTVKERLTDAGYTIIPALVSCVVDGNKIGPALTNFTPTLYYPSTLHLLALSYLAERHPECLS
jgi:endo-1,4-beta-D-glucanase Y